MQLRAAEVSLFELFALTEQLLDDKLARVTTIAMDQLQAEPFGEFGCLLSARFQLRQHLLKVGRFGARRMLLKRFNGLFPAIKRLLLLGFVRRQTGGVGLGLAITERAVALHGGTIRALNRPQGGLMVEIRLPLGEDASDAAGTRVSEVVTTTEGA